MCAVEWKKLGDVCEVGTGSNNREDACDNGLYPFYVRSKDVLRINKYLFDEEAIIIPGEGGIGDIFHYANGKYGLHQRAYRVHPIDGEVVCKYLYYYLSDKFKQYIVSKSVGATATSIRKPMLEGFMLPIPSLAKQQEIVSQLDTFTTLISNLESELDMRRKQYEHYRNQLLDFEGVKGIEWKTLGENIAVLRGKRLTKNELLEDGRFPVYHGGLEALGFYDKKNREKDTVMVINVGASAGTVGYCACDFWSSDGCFCLSKNDCLYSKFLYNLLKIREHLISSKVRKAGIPTLDSKVIEDLIIPIVDIKTQQEIVEKLDAFEQLIQSLEQEIKLRKQQYEYYREKLLTFD